MFELVLISLVVLLLVLMSLVVLLLVLMSLVVLLLVELVVGQQSVPLHHLKQLIM